MENEFRIVTHDTTRFCMRSFLLIFFSGVVSLCMAQHYPILHYTSQDGLSQLQVMTTFRDSRNYLWIGTKYGFCKFDGERFERFAPNEKTIGNIVRKFAEDKKGYLYIESNNVISRFDGKCFTPLKQDKQSYVGICIDKTNRLFCLNTATGELFTSIQDSLVAAKWPSLQNKRLSRLIYDFPKQVLIANIDSLGLVEITPERLTPVAKVLQNASATDSWLRARGGETVIYRYFGGKNEQFLTEFGPNNWQPFLQITNQKWEVLRPIEFDWLFTFESKTYLLEAKSQKVTRVLPNEFNHNTVTYSTHGTWVGTEKGLVFIVQNGIKYFPENEVPYAWSVVEDAQKRMWFLNYLQPIQQFDGNRIETVKGYAEKVFSQLKAAKVSNIPTSQDGWYYAALRDKLGHLWLPNSSGAVWHDGQKWELLLRPTAAHKTSIAFGMLEDADRNVVLQGGEGAVHIFDNKPPFRTTSLDQTNGMNIKPYVLAMALEKTGVYWFGGVKMLSRYDSKKEKWTEYSVDNQKLGARGIFDLKFDSKGTLWLATFTKGLCYLDSRRDTVRCLSTPELKEPVNAIFPINDDFLFIGSLRNVYVLNLKKWYASQKVELRCFNHHNGFVAIEPGQNGFYRDSKGQIWLTGGAALSVIDPKKINFRPERLRTYVSKLNGQRLPFSQFLADSTFTLPFDEGNVRLEFESVGEDKPFVSQYSYLVEGVTDGWSAWQEEPVATLVHLASGTYTVRVKSRTGGIGVSKSQEATIRFSIRVWPWNSPYFPYYASLAIVGLLTIGGVIYWNNQKQVRREMRTAREQAEKAAKTEQMVKVLEVQTAQAQMHPHFIFNVLNTLQGLVYKQETARANEHIVKLGELMRNYLSASLSLDGTRESLERGMITLEQEIKLLQMYVDFEQLQYRDRFEVFIEVQPSLSPDFYRIPPLLIQPFVENAIKHGVLGDLSRKGHVWIRFWLDTDEALVCEVEDDGIGRKAAEQKRRNAYQTHRSEGTNLVKNRVKLLNELGFYIDIHTIDLPERGTHVIIRMNDRL